MPCSIVESVEDVKEHDSDVSVSRPIGGDVTLVSGAVLGACVSLLICIATSPNGECKDEQHGQDTLGTDGSSDSLNIQRVTKDCSSHNLGHVVKNRVQSLGAGIEASTVDGVDLVGGEPVGRPEHGEEQDDEGLELNGLVKSDKLGLPAGILHQNDSGSVRSDNIASVTKKQGEDSSAEHEHDESNVGSISDGLVGLYVDVLSDRD